MKRNIRYDRMALLGVLVFVLVISLWSIVGVLSKKKPNDPTPSSSSGPSLPTEEKTAIDLIDYKIYRSDALDFHFVIARFRFRDEKGVHYPLSQMVTDENIALDSIRDYVGKLEESSFYLGAENVVYTVDSSEKELTVSLFIPYKKEKGELILTEKLNNKEYRFDLSKEAEDIKSLQHKTNQEIVLGETKFFISDSFVSDRVTYNGNEYTFPSSVQIYTFKLNVEALSGNGFVIESASFVSDSGAEEYSALGAGYRNVRQGLDSLVGKTLSVGDVGALLFEVYAPGDVDITMSGIVRLKIKGIEKAVEILTRLN